MAFAESWISHPSQKYTTHIVVMPQHSQGLCHTCKLCHYAALNRRCKGLITRLWGSLRWRGAKVSSKSVYVTEENVRNDRRPATGTRWQKLFTDVKRQVGGILVILCIAVRQVTKHGLCKIPYTLLRHCLCLSPSHKSNSVDPPSGQPFCIPLYLAYFI